MPDTKRILNAIADMARQLGRPPARAEFLSRSRITTAMILQSFSTWSQAIRAAGLRPYSLNAKIDDIRLLEDWGKTARRNKTILKSSGKLPRHIYRRQGKYSPHTLANRFGGWESVARAFRQFAGGKPHWRDVLALLPAPMSRRLSSQPTRSRTNQTPLSSIPIRKARHAPLAKRPTYGNPMPMPEFRHEPVNEQGVVLLFGILAKDLGYMVESVQNSFPDCEAKRLIAPNRWQRVHIEFEFESRNFQAHGHPPIGCDLIVCWRHNWPACPNNIEVLELSTLLNSTPSP